MDPGGWVCRGSMLIQVRSVLESQEWLVMVEPSTEANLPTSRLVQQSVQGGSEEVRGWVPPTWDGQAYWVSITAEHWRLDWKATADWAGKRKAVKIQATRGRMREGKRMVRNSFQAKGLGHPVMDG